MLLFMACTKSGAKQERRVPLWRSKPCRGEVPGLGTRPWMQSAYSEVPQWVRSQGVELWRRGGRSSRCFFGRGLSLLLSACLFLCLFRRLGRWFVVGLSIRLSVCLSVSLPVTVSVCLSFLGGCQSVSVMSVTVPFAVSGSLSLFFSVFLSFLIVCYSISLYPFACLSVSISRQICTVRDKCV